MLCLAVVFHSLSTWREHQTQSQRAGSEEALSATSAALGDIKESYVDLDKTTALPVSAAFPSEAQTNASERRAYGISLGPDVDLPSTITSK